jgi:hypothetical protein
VACAVIAFTDVRSRERQVQRPPKALPLQHALHPDVRHLITHGEIKNGSNQFRPLLADVRPGGSNAWSPSLLATVDFCQTVSQTSGLSDALRPVNWIVSCIKDDGTILVAMSPFEVNALLPAIRRSQHVHLHMYTPRVIRSQESFSDLCVHVIPPLPDDWTPPARGLLSQIDLWAGGLYLDDYDTYVQLCAFLGIYTHKSAELYARGDVPRQSDGFVALRDRGQTAELAELLEDFEGKSFTRSPIEPLRRLVNYRCDHSARSA